MASLEAAINQYTIEIKEKEAKNDDLWTQKRQLKDADHRKDLEDDIQALEGVLKERVKLRRELQDRLLGEFLDSSGSTLTANICCLLHLSRLFAQPAWRTAVTAVATR